MDKNRIGGSHDGTSGQQTTKSISIKRCDCKSGGRASKAAKLTSGDLRRVAESQLRGPRGPLTAAQKSAEGVVVRDVGKASEALQGRKAQQRIGFSRERRMKARTIGSGQ
jgi:hypothetical protein